MKLPEINLKPTALFNLHYGTIRSWLLTTAVELKIFNQTSEQKTAVEIAAAIQSHGANTELFLNALCSLELLIKENGCYVNTELAETFLVEGKETYSGGLLLMNEQWNFESRTQMKELVLNGPQPQQEASDYTGDYFADYVMDMRNLSRSGQSQLMAKELGRLPGFADMRTMLDLGGAHGMDCIATVMRNPNLKGIVYDHPAVVEITRQVITEYSMEERVAVMGGDYATDSIGSGYDLIYAKATLNSQKGNLGPLFEKIHDALNPGGVFISVHDGLTDEGTKPADQVISGLPVVLSAFDFSFEADMVPDAMLEAGFKSVRTRPVPFLLGGVLDMAIGRK